MRFLSRWLAIEPQKAAEKIVHVLSDQDSSGPSGMFYEGTRDVGFKKGIAERPEKFEQIWKLSLELAEMQSWRAAEEMQDAQT